MGSAANLVGRQRCVLLDEFLRRFRGLGGEFDPEAFDVDEVNRELAGYFG
jgi:hypothetical protein